MTDWVELTRTDKVPVHVRTSSIELIEPRCDGGCSVYTAHQIVSVVESIEEIRSLLEIGR